MTAEQRHRLVVTDTYDRGNKLDAQVTVTDAAGIILEPDGNNHFLTATNRRIEIVPSIPQQIAQSISAERAEIINKMSTDPQYFVGRHVFKYFEEDDSVWRGTVVEWHRNKDTPENLWVVRFRVSPPEPDYPDGYTEDWDHGEMRQWGIDFIVPRWCEYRIVVSRTYS